MQHHLLTSTGAVGRALAMLGYGIQFTDELDEHQRIVDTPITPPQARQAKPSNPPAAVQPTPAPSQSDADELKAWVTNEMNAIELKAIQSEVKALGLAEDSASFMAWKVGILGVAIPNKQLTTDHLTLLRHALEDLKMQGVPASPAA